MSAADVLAARAATAAKINSKPSAARAKVNLLPNSKILGDKIPSLKTWYILNTDTGEIVNGQFESNDVSESVGSAYSNTFALNREHAITQFQHGRVETINFTARFYALYALQDLESRISKLKSWSKRNPRLGRPPILYFWVGNQHVKSISCVMPSVTVRYDRAGFLGSMRGAKVSISIQRYEPFSLTDTANFDTFYHFVKLGDTYELLAQRTYKNPLLGVELRDQNPKLRALSPGNIIKLPSPTGSIRRAVIKPKSIALRGILDRRDNPQKSNLVAVLAARANPQTVYQVA